LVRRQTRGVRQRTNRLANGAFFNRCRTVGHADINLRLEKLSVWPNLADEVDHLFGVIGSLQSTPSRIGRISEIDQVFCPSG
jgi:hypothetical protein